MTLFPVRSALYLSGCGAFLIIGFPYISVMFFYTLSHDSRHRHRHSRMSLSLIVHKPPQFQSTPTRRRICPFGRNSSSLIVTLVGTSDGSRKLSVLDSIQITYLETIPAEFVKHEYLQSKNTTAGARFSKLQVITGPVKLFFISDGSLKKV